MLERLDQWALKKVIWLDRFGVGKWLRGLAVLYLPLWALALDSDFVPENWWVRLIGNALFVVLLVVGTMLQRHRNTATLARLTAQLRSTNASFAGALESLGRSVEQGSQRALSEDESKRLCTMFLARVRSFAYLALGMTEDEVRLRVTLAVPLREDEGPAHALRVWCYDQSYDDRRFTTLDIQWPGAPEAFRKGAVRTIDDLRALDLPVSQDRRFRSVISFPALSRLDHKEPLCIVSLDAEPSGFFDLETTDRLSAYLQPAVQAVGLVILLRRRDAKYKFG